MAKIQEPSEGNWLTQVTLEDESQRVFSKMLINPKEGEWVEWTDEEKVKWEEEHPIEEPNFEE